MIKLYYDGNKYWTWDKENDYEMAKIIQILGIEFIGCLDKINLESVTNYCKVVNIDLHVAKHDHEYTYDRINDYIYATCIKCGHFGKSKFIDNQETLAKLFALGIKCE